MESGFDELGQKSIIAGKIIIVSGPSSAGKGTVVKQLVSMYENYELAIETTSREPRLGETDGIQYHFISEKAFLEAIKKNKFFEYSRYIGSYYGTLKDPVYSSVKRGKNVVLEMSSSEALQLKRKYPEMILVYILPPDLDTIIKRLTDREQDNERVRNRLSVYSTEAYSMLRGDLLLVNDDLVRTVRKLVTFINNPFEIDEDFDDHAELVYSLKKGIEQYLNTESYKSSKSSHRDTFNEATAAINLSMELREIRAMLDSLIGGKEIIDVNGKSIGGVMKVNNEENPISPQDKGDAFIEDISYISEIRKMKLPELTFKNFILMFVNHSIFRMNMTKMESVIGVSHKQFGRYLNEDCYGTVALDDYSKLFEMFESKIVDEKERVKMLVNSLFMPEQCKKLHYNEIQNIIIDTLNAKCTSASYKKIRSSSNETGNATKTRRYGAAYDDEAR